MNYLELKQLTSKMNEDIREQIAAIKVQIPGISQIKSEVHCFTVRASQLTSHCCWDPFFYDIEYQKQEVDKILSKSDSLDATVKALNKIVSSAALPNGRRLHPDFANEIKRVLKDNEMIM